MLMKRRTLIKGLMALALSQGIKVPAFALNREPYVSVESDPVGYIGPNPGGFIGGQCVTFVDKWDGVGYPVTLNSNSYPPEKEIYYDFDLADLNKEVPDGFWGNPENDKYPNVHTYVRMQRFGETLRESIIKLNMANKDRDIARANSYLS